jgi:hypothetical protein
MATTADTDRQAELARLRERVAELERELLAQAERTERVVADAQRQTYWLDRWHLDLDALMRRRLLAVPLDTAFRAARKLRHVLQRVRRRLGQSS